MDGIRSAFGVSLASAAVLGAALLFVSLDPLASPAVPTPVQRIDGMASVHEPVPLGELLVADLSGPAPQWVFGVWQDMPVMVLKLERAPLAAAAAHHGYNTGQHAVAVPGEPEHVLLAYQAKNTHLGCSNGWADFLGASQAVADYDQDGVPDGRFLSPCHQEQYDAYDMGAHQPGTPGNGPLDVFSLRLDDQGTVLIAEHLAQDRSRDADREGPGAPFRLAN